MQVQATVRPPAGGRVCILSHRGWSGCQPLIPAPHPRLRRDPARLGSQPARVAWAWPRCGEGCQQAQSPAAGDGVGPRVRAELLVQVAHMSPHGVTGQVQLAGDLRPPSGWSAGRPTHGSRCHSEHEMGDGRWVTLLDPEGNESDVVADQA
jgi:hypothetical protein